MRHNQSTAVKKQRGSLTIIAIFVVVVLALLGLSLADQLRTNSQTLVYEVLGARAMLAAQTGLQTLASKSFPLDADEVICNDTAGSSFDVSDLAGLQNCSFTTRCDTKTIEINDVETMWFYQFESTGVCQGGGQWASRTLAQEAVVEL